MNPPHVYIRIPVEYDSETNHYIGTDLKALQATQEYITKLADNERDGHNVFFYGASNGGGKTQLAHYVMRAAKAVRPKWVNEELKVATTSIAIVSFSNFKEVVHRARFEEEDRAKEALIYNSDWLLLDEISDVSVLNNTQDVEKLLTLLDHRIANRLPTVYTSNFNDLERLKRLIGNAAHSRLLYKTKLVPTNSESDTRVMITEAEGANETSS